MQQLAPGLSPSPVEAEVVRIRGLLQSQQFLPALAAAQALLREVPENRDVLYMVAVAERYLRRLPEALAALDRLESVHPGYSRLHQERGHALAAAGRPDDAVAAYLHAVRLNPALPGSWKPLATLLKAAGREEDARLAAQHVAKLASLPVAVVTASSMFADGEVHEAERVIRQHLKGNPRDIEAMRLLAQIGMKLEIYEDAEFLLESVLVFAPDYHLARYEYVQALLQRHRHEKALEQCRILLAVDPKDRSYRAIYATTCVALSRYDEALDTYRSLVAETPDAADLHLSIAHALKTMGRQAESIDAYRRAAAARPSFGDAYWSLANLKTYRFADDEIARMRAEEARPALEPVDRWHLCFALGKALEDRGAYEESFRYYDRGNALKVADSHYRPEQSERSRDLQKARFTSEFLLARRGTGSPRSDPIFIVGLPRAGSTLIEQILASHSAIEGTQELSDISRMAQELMGRVYDPSSPRYPGVLGDLTPDQLRAFGERYLADTQIYRTGRPHFIDKNPNNFWHVGFIHLILPNARIIDARREAMACCFGNFKQLFATGQEFTYGLDNIARYYRAYVEMMAHWDSVLPGKVLRVQHEDVVEDLDGNVRRLLEFLGLPFEPQCLEFHKTERSVRTASSEQVRQPIFREGLDQWRHYEPWLGPLKDALAGSVALPPVTPTSP
ncbi:MAG TPA: sulfotransferase [Stellaceae bacterium]|nr:sulfotransferase [Stellaceae bacterium]